MELMLSCFCVSACAVSQALTLLPLPLLVENLHILLGASSVSHLGEHYCIASFEMNHSSPRPSRDYYSPITSEFILGAFFL